jgi:hypothetical protein
VGGTLAYLQAGVRDWALSRHGNPLEFSESSFEVNVLGSIGPGVVIMTKIMMIRAGTDVLPGLPLIDTQGITFIQWLLAQLFPHAAPFLMVMIYVFE